jgi:mannose-6-phosphate isomerase
VWGGDKLQTYLDKDFKGQKNIGESWELSGVDGDISVVNNGFLKGNNLTELMEVYMGDLMGERVFEKFGLSFPLLIKFIDAREPLSIQVHPDDQLAKKRHQSFGKTEMWYVMQAEEKARLINGFAREVKPAEYVKAVENNTIESILSSHPVHTGDVFFIPAGRVHAIGAGIVIAEIQQTSDITYRIYDFGRVDKDGKPRELHTQQAMDAIDYKLYDNFVTKCNTEPNRSVEAVSCPYFSTRILEATNTVIRDYYSLDSFVILIATEGEAAIKYEGGIEKITKGETVLIPADLREIEIVPNKTVKLLEVYVPH